MKQLFRAVALVVILSWFGAVLASVTTGTMRVTVRDAGGGPLRGAQVTAETVDGLSKRTVITDAAGETVLLGLDPSAKYVVTTVFSGYNSARNDNVLVRTGETTTLSVEISPGLTETVHVVAQSPLVDVTTAMASQDITLDLTESLPTGRSYQSYLQLVPGVGPDAFAEAGFQNPASRSGLNYSSDGCTNGCSTDNLYFIEGINVTGISDGRSGANFNTEAIQEQSVITGGIPAEYKGAPGLISNVVTKSGGNNFSGSVNYFFQNNDLVTTASRTDLSPDDFSTYDSAFTLGGPIKRDKAWFFVSYRKLNRKDHVTDETTGALLRTVVQDEDQYYAKLTWQLTGKDRLSGTFLADPRDNNGSPFPFVVNTRLEQVETGAPRYNANYQRVFNSGVLEFGVSEHPDEASFIPVLREPYNEILFDMGQSFTYTDQQLGGSGDEAIYEDTNELIDASTEWLVNSSWGQHTIKGGFTYEDHKSNDDYRIVTNAAFRSLNNDLPAFLGMPVTADYLASGAVQGIWWRVTNPSHVAGLIATIDGLPNRDSFYALLDTDLSNDISMAEAGAIVFDSTAGNPNGAINYIRRSQPDPKTTAVGSEGLSVYLQDTLQRGRWTVNLGVRAETWEHFASTGASIMKFDWELAPRVSVIRDIKGDGKQKLSAYYGRYYDPARNNLTSFAGTLIRPLVENQLFVNGEWVTYQRFGGPTLPDSVFAPTTKTPYADEWQLGYEIDLGRNMSLATNIIKRETRNLLDDYDLSLYAHWDPNDPTSTYYPGPVDHPDSLFLGLDYFGFEQFPNSSYVIATLAGGWRDWEGFEVIFRRRQMNHWQAIASYSYGDAHGNTNSDSSLSAQSDFIELDPRAPNATGRLPGTIRHLFKLLGSYNWNNGIKLGATYRWNSGTLENRLLQPGVPVLTGYPGSTVAPFEFAGIMSNWIEPGSVGTLEGPAWSVTDLRAQYNHRFGSVATEFFVDVFNVFNAEDTIRYFPLINGVPNRAYREPTEFVPPRRFFVGARASF